MSVPQNATVTAICRLAVGVALVALVTHTWFVMGLVVPVTVAGSSMAPTLSGPRQCYRCGACQRVFAVGLDQLASIDPVCPDCGNWSDVVDLGTAAGSRILVDRTAFLSRAPRRWEVAVFRSPADKSELCVKRIVGLPGEVVAVTDGSVRIDGQSVVSPTGTKYELRAGDDARLQDGWRLGPREYFVLGDNSAVSDDSRSWPTGPGLDAKLLVGRPIGVR
ncbi:MAG: signal peptidase I [Pirellulales bacterium]